MEAKAKRSPLGYSFGLERGARGITTTRPQEEKPTGEGRQKENSGERERERERGREEGERKALGGGGKHEQQTNNRKHRQKGVGQKRSLLSRAEAIATITDGRENSPLEKYGGE